VQTPAREQQTASDLGLSRGGYAVRARALFASLGLHALAGGPRELLETL